MPRKGRSCSFPVVHGSVLYCRGYCCRALVLLAFHPMLMALMAVALDATAVAARLPTSSSCSTSLSSSSTTALSRRWRVLPRCTLRSSSALTSWLRLWCLGALALIVILMGVVGFEAVLTSSSRSLLSAVLGVLFFFLVVIVTMTCEFGEHVGLGLWHMLM